MKPRSWVMAIALAISILSVPCFGARRFTVSDEPAGGSGSPQLIVLRNHEANIEVAVAPTEGGELSSYRVQFRGKWIELLYHARDYSSSEGFKGKGPVLWPAVGAQFPIGTFPKTACGDGSYVLGGKTYPMPCHGFARTLPWSEIERKADDSGAHVTLELRDSEATRKLYPFGFQLTVTYRLTRKHVFIEYAVKADPANTEPMPFSIGNHIAFKIPFVEGTAPADMMLLTNNTSQLLRNPQGTLSGEEKPQSFGGMQRLGDFDARVALVLAGYQHPPMARLMDPQGMSVTVSQSEGSSLPEPLVRFVIYGGPQAGYICPEPWFGVQNSLNTGKGLVELAPGKSWKWHLELQAEGSAAPPAATDAVEKVGGDFGFVEGPVWTKDGSLVFSDIFKSHILKLTSPDHTEIYRDHSNAANGNSMDVQGRLYSCERDGRRVVRMEKDGSLTVIASEWQGKKLNSPNDVVVRRDGQIYFSDPASKAVTEPQELGFNGVYHVTPEGKSSLITDKMVRPNGVAVTPDGRTLYVADTDERKVLAFDLDDEGNASNQRVFIADIDGGPDGLRVASNGNLYIACRGIAIYTKAGNLVKTIEFPETPANCAFGDSDLRTLYVTARTSVYRVRVPDRGDLQY